MQWVMTKMCGEHIQASMRRSRFPPISAEDTVGRQFPASLSTFFRRKRWSQNAGAPTLLRPALRLLAGSSKASEPTRLSHGGCDRHDARAFPFTPRGAPARPLRMTSRGERFTLSPHILALSRCNSTKCKMRRATYEKTMKMQHAHLARGRRGFYFCRWVTCRRVACRPVTYRLLDS